MNPRPLLEDFDRAIGRLEEALDLRPSDEIRRAGCIQYFEFTFELAWKAIQAMAAYYGVEPVRSPRAAFKAAFGQGWVSEQEPWLEMLEARNRMSHTYNAEEALEVFDQLERFRLPLRDLHRSLYQALQNA